jgi:TatD DNase family protein
MIIDTHTHLDNIKYKDDRDLVIKKALDSGIGGFLIPAASKDDLEEAYNLANSYKEIFFAVGTHPYDYKEFDLSNFDKYIEHKKCIAVGECGLDYYRLPKDEDEKIEEINIQKEIFISQIEYAIKYDKPLIIHIRDASNDSLEILSSYDNIRGVLHCYNADEQLLHLKDNFYYGIGGVVTFKNGKKLKNILPKIPINRLILETDSPYLTPHPHRGERNEPKYLPLVAKEISNILNIPYQEIQDITNSNTKELFKEFCQLI